MILRRVIAQFRKQEWTAIAIDFLIVVIGVFVGLQVSNWNAERQTHARQAAVLSQLAAELDQSVAEAEQRIAFQQRMLDEIEIVIAAVATGALDPKDREAFSSGLNLLNGWWQPAWRLATVDELIAQGDLDLVPDPNLRSGLVAYRDTVEVIRADIVMMLEDISANMPAITRHVRSTPTDWRIGQGTEAETATATLFAFDADLPALRADAAAGGALHVIRRNQTYVLLNQITIRNEAIRLRDQLKAMRE